MNANGAKFDATQGNTWRGIRFLDLNTTTPGASTITNSEITGVYKPSTGYCAYYDSNYAGAIFIDNSDAVTISYCEIHDNDVCDCGGGIFIGNDSDPAIYNNEIYENSANRAGGGIAIYSGAPDIYLNIIEDNECTTNGGGVYNLSTSAFDFYNNLIDNNFANLNGGGLYTGNSTQISIFNCTIADNTANGGSGGGIYQGSTTSFTSKNNIIWGNDAFNSTYNQTYPAPNGNNGYSECCIENSTTPIPNCSSCVISSPQFVGNGDYHITYTSSCIDEGNNTVTHDDDDLDGNDRIQDYKNKIDIGAYETQFAKVDCGDLSTETWTNHNISGVDYYISCNIKVPSCSTLTVNSGTTIVFDQGIKLDVEGTLTAEDPTHSNYITFTATDPDDGWGGIRFGDASTSYGGTSSFEYCDISYVKKTLTPTVQTARNPSYSGGIFIYSNSTTDIDFDYCKIHDNQVASHGGGILCFDCPDDVVIQNSDIYNNKAKIKGGGISLKGESLTIIQYNNIYGNEAIIGGGGVWICADNVSTPNPAPLIYDNNIYSNTLTSDYISPQGSTATNGGGGIGLSSSNAIIELNTIYNNTTNNGYNNTLGYGGGINVCTRTGAYMSEPTIRNNTIYDNNAEWGGGISFVNSGGEIYLNSIYYDNTAFSDGGGIFMKSSSTPTIHNCLIANNIATGDGGGIFMDDASAKVYNCTVSDNTATSGDGVYSINTANPVFINDIIYPDDVLIDGNPPQDNYLFQNCDMTTSTWWGSFNHDDGNIDDDPQFTSYGGYDYLPSNISSPVSPCIGAGQTISGFTQPTYDLRGNYYRTVGQIDIGAFEHPGNQSYKIAKPDSIFNELISDQFIVYPNPVKSYFIVLWYSESEGNVTFNLINTLGEIVYSSEFSLIEGENFLQIDRQQLPAGIYYLKLNSSTIDSKVVKILFE